MLVIVVVLALAMERVAFRPARGARADTLLVTSFAVSFLLQSLAIVLARGAATERAGICSELSNESFSVGRDQDPQARRGHVVVTAVLARGARGLPRPDSTRSADAGGRGGLPHGARARGSRQHRDRTAFALSGLLAGSRPLILVAQTGVVLADDGAHAGAGRLHRDDHGRPRQPHGRGARRVRARRADRRAPGDAAARVAGRTAMRSCS